MSVRCGNCKQEHNTAAGVRECYRTSHAFAGTAISTEEIAKMSTEDIGIRRIEDGVYTVNGDVLRLRPADFAKDLPAGSQVIEYLSGSDYVSFAFIIKGKLRVWRRFSWTGRQAEAARALLTMPTLMLRAALKEDAA